MLKPSALYIGDNGRIACGKHCGTTAQLTGRDLGGTEMIEVTPAIAAEWRKRLEGEAIACEDCEEHS